MSNSRWNAHPRHHYSSLGLEAVYMSDTPALAMPPPRRALSNGTHVNGSFNEEPHEDPKQRLRQGQLFAQQGEYERALVEFSAAIHAGTLGAMPFVYRGDAYRLRGEYTGNRELRRRAARPESLVGILNRGLAIV